MRKENPEPLAQDFLLYDRGFGLGLFFYKTFSQMGAILLPIRHILLLRYSAKPTSISKPIAPSGACACALAILDASGKRLAAVFP